MQVLKNSIQLIHALEGVSLRVGPAESLKLLRTQLSRVTSSTTDFIPRESIHLAVLLASEKALPVEARNALAGLVKEFQSNPMTASMFEQANQFTGV